MSPTRRRRPVAVVTDSTAGLPDELIAERGVTVVPLTVSIDGASGREGVDVTPGDVAKALVARRSSVTTSRPSPGEFTTAYDRLLDEGAAGIVSVPLSAKLSGTYESARLAAVAYPDRVAVVDSQSTGMGLGFAVLAAGGLPDLDSAVAAARAAVARTTTLFYVDTLEYLRRGGRIGAASALLGTALSVKPILRMVDGEIVVRDKVRTASRALARLVRGGEERDPAVARRFAAVWPSTSGASAGRGAEWRETPGRREAEAAWRALDEHEPASVRPPAPPPPSAPPGRWALGGFDPG